MAPKLSQDEINTLDADLAKINGSTIPNIEMLDGFFAALHASPLLSVPSEWMPLVLNQEDREHDLPFEDLEQTQSFLDLVMKHWNAVGSQLAGKSLFLPIIEDNANDSTWGEAWAQGYMKGVELHRSAWGPLFDDEEKGGLLITTMILAFDNDPVRRLPAPNPLSEEKREEAVHMAIAGAQFAYDYFKQDRSAEAEFMSDPFESNPKIGRNEPCPCGSGKKYKKCCLNEPTYH